MPDSAKSEVRILIVDDHALFRDSVARLLAAEPYFRVIEPSSSVEEALQKLRKTPADIVLLDFDLGQQDGAEFMRFATQQGLTGKVLVVTAGLEKEQALDLIRQGISGIFMKHQSAALLIEAIHDVLAGKVWFDRDLLQEAVGGAPLRPESKERKFTDRERQVLTCVFEGLGNKEIAERLTVSESAVKATLQQLFSKTGVRTRSQLVRIALEQYRNQL
jgi:two-component system, NarL family, nitrate/nitrite response regulator NarL